jgi:hypothetical protein
MVLQLQRIGPSSLYEVSIKSLLLLLQLQRIVVSSLPHRAHLSLFSRSLSLARALSLALALSLLALSLARSHALSLSVMQLPVHFTSIPLHLLPL